MMRLLARDSGAVAVLPAVVVKDEIAQGILSQYQSLPDIYEYFYAISSHKKVVPEALKILLQHARSSVPQICAQSPRAFFSNQLKVLGKVQFHSQR